ncbi:unnamed protein product, partial [Tetraodon nigroviridis]
PGMLYFQVVILAALLMLVYYCEFTDTFAPAQRGFVCGDPALSRPDPGPEQHSRLQPVVLCSVLGGLPVVLISGVEVIIFLLQHNSHLYDAEKVVMMGDCCYVNPMVRRTFQFLGNLSDSPRVYLFGLFATDIFVNAGQLMTGSLAPHFLAVCRPNYTALGCQEAAQFVSQSDACTGDPEDIARARKTFPSKEAAVSLYAAVYLAVSAWTQRPGCLGGASDTRWLSFQMYLTACVGPRAGRLTGPVLSLALVCLAGLTGINRVAEYRNHWTDVLAGQALGGAVAVFL